MNCECFNNCEHCYRRSYCSYDCKGDGCKEFICVVDECKRSFCKEGQ